jgi:hypothetical protein
VDNKGKSVDIRRILFVALLCVAGGKANACDLKAANAAFKAGDYANSRTIASKGNSSTCLQTQADAAFAAGNQQEAHALYARSLAAELDDAFDETKGSSKFWSGVGTAVGILAMAGSMYAASEGVMNAEQATSTMMQGQEIVSSVDEGFKQATGNIDHRNVVKSTIKDLRALSRRKSSSFQPINTSWSRLPGAGLARVHVNGQTCNAVRSSRGRYLASHSCLLRGGLEQDKYISIGSGLRQSELAKVSSQQPLGDLVALDVNSRGETDHGIADAKWAPHIYLSGSPVKYAAVWHAPELNRLVPVFQECDGSRFEACGDIYGNSATLWVSDCANADCLWSFYGIAGANGQIERLAK